VTRAEREEREEIFAAAVLRQVERGRAWLMVTTEMVEETTRQARAKRKKVERAIGAQGGRVLSPLLSPYEAAAARRRPKKAAAMRRPPKRATAVAKRRRAR
jgi:hypothetical protein